MEQLVPIWNNHAPSLLQSSREQKEFYHTWVVELENNQKIDLEGNVAYLFLYLFDCITDFLKSYDINELHFRFGLIEHHYSDYESVLIRLNQWKADSYLLFDDFENAWQAQKGGRIRIEDIVFIRGKCKSKTIDGYDVFNILKSDKGLTRIGKGNIYEVVNYTNKLLNEFYESKGENIVENFVNKFNLSELLEDDFNLLKRIIANETTYQLWKSWYIKDKNEAQDDKRTLFLGASDRSLEVQYIYIPSIVSIATHSLLQELIREAENLIRENKGLPKVGEGWLSETELYTNLMQSFQKDYIVHHGRPEWLNRQHFDIYFPDKNIAIEYQGEQHNKPIDYFGGEESFKKQQELDERKKHLCLVNKCELIYVYEGYDYDELISKIENILGKR